MIPRPHALTATLVAGAATLLAATSALAWGAQGHRFIGQAAMLALPAELPGFLRTREAVAQVGELAREPDRSKGAGQPHDSDLDPGHFVDIDDAGHVFDAQGPAIADLPRSHGDYDVALAKAGIDPFKAGYLPYNIEDGYEQLVRDFAYWRIENLMAKRAKDPAQRAFYAADLVLRERITVRDLGVWAHYVGDASQPLHASIHYNGWGDYPNANGYTRAPIHGPFEGDFVFKNVSLQAVQAAMPAAAACGPTIQGCTSAYLLNTASYVVPLYEMWKTGAFGITVPEHRAGSETAPAARTPDAPPSPQAVRFTVDRVAAGAAKLRDLVVQAWRESDEAKLGRGPDAIAPHQVEAGADPKFALFYGDD